MRLSKASRPFQLGALALVCAAACGKAPAEGSGASLKVAAAADLAVAFKEVGDAFEKSSGAKVAFSFGSTGLLAQQVAQGAPFDVFAAANISFVDDVIRSGHCREDSKALYARGRIVVWTKKDGATVASLKDLAAARFVKIAVANPEHAPYGRAAQQALTTAGVWDTVKPKLVFGENVLQALQFAQTGNAEAAIVALSIAVGTDGQVLQIDPSDYQPLEQALVVCAKDANQKLARDFTAFVNSAEGRVIMKRYGFLLPGEALTSARP
jgi:molybdate transport system substrate-binding protein